MCFFAQQKTNINKTSYFFVFHEDMASLIM